MAKATKKKALKKAAPKKAVKKTAKKPVKKAAKKAPKKAPVDNVMRGSNGDPIGAKVLNTQPEAVEEAGNGAKGTEIDASKGAVTVKAKKTAAEQGGSKKSKSVVMRGGVPTLVEDNGDDI
jgi:hypothetical protein